MEIEKTFKVSLTAYPQEFEIVAYSEEQAVRMAKTQVNFSVYESEVEEVFD